MFWATVAPDAVLPPKSAAWTYSEFQAVVEECFSYPRDPAMAKLLATMTDEQLDLAVFGGWTSSHI